MSNELQNRKCADCGKSCKVTPVWTPEINEETTGVFVSVEDSRPFVLCDDCAQKKYDAGDLGFTGSGDAFLV